MKVKMLKENKEIVVSDGYGARLIEQGKAVLVHEKKKAAGKDAAKQAGEKKG